MQPELDLGPITLQTFGIMFALGFIAAGALVARRLVELGKPVDWAYEMIFAALVGGIVGARLDFLIENNDSVKGDLLGNLFSGSGLVWYGGAIGGAIGVVLGIGGSIVVARAAGWPTLIQPEVIVVAVGFSALIGVFFGFYPAQRAARMDPIEALRHE